jgi:hypothetical protein
VGVENRRKSTTLRFYNRKSNFEDTCTARVGLATPFGASSSLSLIVARAALDKLHTHQVRTSSAAPMLYYTETPVDTSSTAHFRTFLCGKAAATKGSKEKSREFSGSMASRAPA